MPVHTYDFKVQFRKHRVKHIWCTFLLKSKHPTDGWCATVCVCVCTFSFLLTSYFAIHCVWHRHIQNDCNRLMFLSRICVYVCVCVCAHKKASIAFVSISFIIFKSNNEFHHENQIRSKMPCHTANLYSILYTSYNRIHISTFHINMLQENFFVTFDIIAVLNKYVFSYIYVCICIFLLLL